MQSGLSHSTPPPFVYINWANYGKWLHQNWFEVIMMVLIFHLLISKEINFSFQINSSREAYNSDYQMQTPKQSVVAIPTNFKEKSFNLGTWLDSKKTQKRVSKKKKLLKKVPRAQHFSNLAFIINPTYAKRKGIPISIVKEKRQNCLTYIKKYVKIALKEQQEKGILASITLAQGLLESNAGESRVAKESSNHFGIKCRRKCRGCTCRNYHDDDIYDMFRVFNNPKESYREHSILLNSPRYRGLKKFGKDYKKWAYGLKKAGYATDKKYAQKLIMIIESLDLYRFDRVGG